MAIIGRINSLSMPGKSTQAPALAEARSQAIARLHPSSKKPKAPAKPAVEKPRDAEYVRSLQLNRDYETVMRQCENGGFQTKEVKGEDLFAKDTEAEQRKKQDKERLKKAERVEKAAEKTGKVAEKTAAVPRRERVWCAHCNFKHADDYHRQQQRAPKRSPYTPHTNVFGVTVPRGEQSETDSEMDDFIVPDEQPQLEAVSREIRKMFKYNPRKYVDNDADDRRMEASYEEIMHAEKRTARIGEYEDAAEFEKLQKRRK